MSQCSVFSHRPGESREPERDGKGRQVCGGGLTSHVASKTYLDLPSFYEPPEYSVVICADDDEYAGRAKVLQKVCLTSPLLVTRPIVLQHSPSFSLCRRRCFDHLLTSPSQFISSDDPSTVAAAAAAAASSSNTAASTAAATDQDRRCRKLMDISGLHTSVELLEMGPETDQAMLRYQVEYAEAFAFVFSLYSAKTLETAQKLHDKVERGARNHHNIITMSDYDKDGGMSVPVFLIGNRDGDLAPPQGELGAKFLPVLLIYLIHCLGWRVGGAAARPVCCW